MLTCKQRELEEGRTRRRAEARARREAARAPVEARALAALEAAVATAEAQAELAMGRGGIQTLLSIFYQWFSIQNIPSRNDSMAHG